MKYRIKDGLPIKYDLLIHTAMPNYPTSSDFIVDVCSYFIRVYESKNKPLEPADLKFSVKTLKYIFGDLVEKDDFRQKIKKILADGIEDGSLSKKGDFVFISESAFTKYFSIV
jgi:hypothetical protein